MSERRADIAALDRFCREVLAKAGADSETAADAARAMLHGSTLGVDSHGVRLLPHYVKAIRGGRVNGRPSLSFERTRAGSSLLEADHAHGARATFAAAAHACDLAAEAGIGAVGIRNSSHFGPAGAYSSAIAARGCVGLVFGNSDSFVRLHDGAERFHGTNPISVAVPAPGNPWLLDMATSAIPYNRVQLYRSQGREMPEGTGSDAHGTDTRDPGEVEMLAPLGGHYGFKGAGLAGVSEIFSALLTGMRISPDILPMPGPDFGTPREMGAFVMSLDPEAFAGGAVLASGIEHYLAALRGGPAREGGRVMAPGDREWEEAARRRESGVPIDPATAEAFADLAREGGLEPPWR